MPRWLLAGVAAGCLVVLGGVALIIGEPWETLQAAPSQDVEAPPSPEGTVPEGSERPGVAWEEPTPAVLCQPAPCERWRVHLPSGTSVVDGDTAYHLGSTNWRTEVTAIDVETGAVRWRKALAVPDAVNGAPLDRPSPAPLTGRDDVILVAVDGLIEARSRTDGEVVWAFDREGLLPHAMGHGPSDTVVVFSQVRSTEPGPGPWSSSGTILAVDAITGELRWEREVVMPVTHSPIAGEAILAVTAPDEDPIDDALRPAEEQTIVALDWLTGETLWERPMPRHGFSVAGPILEVYDGAHVEHWDTRTGERIALPAQLPEGSHVEVIGDLVAVRSYPDDAEPGSISMESLQHVAVFDRAEGAERFTATAPGWVAMAALPDGGAVVASGEDELLRLTALASDGDTRWDLKFGVPSATAWLRWPQVLDDGTVTIIAALPGLSDLAAHRIDASTGEPLGSFHLDVDVDGADPHALELRWPVVIDHGSRGTEMRLHGPAGSLEITQHVEVLSVDPLVISTPSGTLARLDEELLLGGT